MKAVGLFYFCLVQPISKGAGRANEQSFSLSDDPITPTRTHIRVHETRPEENRLARSCFSSDLLVIDTCLCHRLGDEVDTYQTVAAAGIDDAKTPKRAGRRPIQPPGGGSSNIFG